jgi:hypothetical protein
VNHHQQAHAVVARAQASKAKHNDQSRQDEQDEAAAYRQPKHSIPNPFDCTNVPRPVLKRFVKPTVSMNVMPSYIRLKRQALVRRQSRNSRIQTCLVFLFGKHHR